MRLVFGIRRLLLSPRRRHPTRGAVPDARLGVGRGRDRPISDAWNGHRWSGDLGAQLVDFGDER